MEQNAVAMVGTFRAADRRAFAPDLSLSRKRAVIGVVGLAPTPNPVPGDIPVLTRLL